MLRAQGLPLEMVISSHIPKRKISEQYTGYDFEKRLTVIEEYAQYKEKEYVLEAIKKVSEFSKLIDKK